MKLFFSKYRFWIFLFLLAWLAVLSFKVLFYFSECQDFSKKEKNALNKTPSASANYKKIDLFCFDDKVLFHCEKNFFQKNICSNKLKKSLAGICKKMEKAKIYPFRKTVIIVVVFEKCSKAIQERAGCMPHFFPAKSNLKGYDAGFIFVDKDVMSDKHLRKNIFGHEIAHAFSSSKYSQMTRIVREFFAVYAQKELFKKIFHITCNGALWNQEAMATFGGEYAFPPKENHKQMRILSICRYGQLEYLITKLQKASPGLFKKLWKRLSSHKKGLIDAAELLRWIKKADKKAWKVALNFHILKKNDKLPKIVFVNSSGYFGFFLYQGLGPEKEKYFEKAGMQIAVKRKNKILGFVSSNNGTIKIPISKLKTNDIVEARATIAGKVLERIIKIQ